jgi:hypothetical protein
MRGRQSVSDRGVAQGRQHGGERVDGSGGQELGHGVAPNNAVCVQRGRGGVVQRSHNSCKCCDAVGHCGIAPRQAVRVRVNTRSQARRTINALCGRRGRQRQGRASTDRFALGGGGHFVCHGRATAFGCRGRCDRLSRWRLGRRHGRKLGRRPGTGCAPRRGGDGWLGGGRGLGAPAGRLVEYRRLLLEEGRDSGRQLAQHRRRTGRDGASRLKGRVYQRPVQHRWGGKRWCPTHPQSRACTYKGSSSASARAVALARASRTSGRSVRAATSRATSARSSAV